MELRSGEQEEEEKEEQLRDSFQPALSIDHVATKRGD